MRTRKSLDKCDNISLSELDDDIGILRIRFMSNETTRHE
jgi:hypothetical protein